MVHRFTNYKNKFLKINVLTNAAPSYGYIFADTYTEIESGQTVDYFCETDIKFNNAGNDIALLQVTSCILHRSLGLPIESVTVGYQQAMPGQDASTYFVCDP